MFEYLIAFGAGLISFLSPCVLPLIPGYISYISGQSLQEILNQKKINFFPLILFCLGISTVFVILGASASFLGQALLQNSEVGFGWTPCIGPILGSILALASIEETLSRAVILLISYSLGLAIPFVLSGYLIQRFLLFSKNFKKNINLISKIGGITLLVTGILILTNQLQAIGFYIIEIFPFMQKFG